MSGLILISGLLDYLASVTSSGPTIDVQWGLSLGFVRVTADQWGTQKPRELPPNAYIGRYLSREGSNKTYRAGYTIIQIKQQLALPPTTKNW